MAFIFTLMRLAVRSIVCLSLAGVLSAQTKASCAGTLYLTIDTGTMKPAEEIAAVLRKHQVKATIFLSNEKTFRNDTGLDPSWTGFWKSMAADGHVFGSQILWLESLDALLGSSQGGYDAGSVGQEIGKTIGVPLKTPSIINQLEGKEDVFLA